MKFSFLLIIFFANISFAQDLVSGKVELNLVSADGMDSSRNAVSFMYFEGDLSDGQIAVNNKIKSFLFYDSLQGSLELADFTLYLKSFNDEFKTVEKESEGDYTMLAWNLETEISIQEFKNTIQLSLSSYNYSGGAHGNGTIYDFIFSKGDGRRLLPEDIFSNMNEVNKIAEVYFRKERGISEMADLAEEGFMFPNNIFGINDNISLDDEYIYVFYNSYEISSYAAGPTLVEIPRSALKKWIRIEF